MNTTLLRLGRRYKGSISFEVPGAPHNITLNPPARSFWHTWSVKWPAIDRDAWCLRGCRLDWHRAMAKAELRKIIAAQGSNSDGS